MLRKQITKPIRRTGTMNFQARTNIKLGDSTINHRLLSKQELQGCNYSERTSFKPLLLPILAIVVTDGFMVLKGVEVSIILLA